VSKIFKSEDRQGHAKGCHFYTALKGNPEIAWDGPIGHDAVLWLKDRTNGKGNRIASAWPNRHDTGMPCESEEHQEN